MDKAVVNQPEKHPHIPARAILDRIILGGSDGAIEGVATTAALNGAGLSFGTIALAGLAFSVAGALSMFFSNYLSRRSELESLKIDIERERLEIETEPEEERGEMETLLRKDGYDEEEVSSIMQRLTQNKDLWLKEMLRRELRVNIEDVEVDPYTRPASAGIAFLLLAMLAVAPYAFPLARGMALLVSLTLSILALFALGSRVFIPKNFRPIAGLESSLVGGLAGGVLYLVGVLISRL